MARLVNTANDMTHSQRAAQDLSPLLETPVLGRAPSFGSSSNILRMKSFLLKQIQSGQLSQDFIGTRWVQASVAMNVNGVEEMSSPPDQVKGIIFYFMSRDRA